tara:strand:+ start:157 stop:396 length:240 start_codon:yes stop_codon:yes gene_type:complete
MPATNPVAVPEVIDCAPADAAQLYPYGADPPLGEAVAVPSEPEQVAAVDDGVTVIAHPGSLTTQLSDATQPFPSVAVTE